MNHLKMVSLSEFLDANPIEASIVYQDPPVYTGDDEPGPAYIRGWRGCRNRLEQINGGEVFQTQSDGNEDEAMGKAIAYALSGRASVLRINYGTADIGPLADYVQRIPTLKAFVQNGGHVIHGTGEVV
jgi:hypothetical protein